jgi:predicted outer membrane repeat protein
MYEILVEAKGIMVEFIHPDEFLAISLLRQRSAVADTGGADAMPQRTLLYMKFMFRSFKFGNVFEIPCTEQGVMLQNTRFVKNKAGVGGAISADKRANTMLSVSSGIFLQNMATGSRGGAIHLSGSRNGARFDRGCEFRGNKVLKGSGGAISIGNSASVHISDSTATDNEALQGGGGFLFLDNAFPSLLQRLDISRGTATSGGGAIAAKASRVALENVTADNCNATLSGGTLFLDGAAEGHLFQSRFSNGQADVGGLIYAATSKLVVHGRNSSIGWPGEPPLSSSSRGVEDMSSGNLEAEFSVSSIVLGQQKYALFSSGADCSANGWNEVVSGANCLEAGFLLRLSGFDSPGSSSDLIQDDVLVDNPVCSLSIQTVWGSLREVQLCWGTRSTNIISAKLKKKRGVAAAFWEKELSQTHTCSKEMQCVCSRRGALDLKHSEPNILSGGRSLSLSDGGGAIGCVASTSDTLLSFSRERKDVPCNNNALALLDTASDVQALACFENGVHVDGARIINAKAYGGGGGIAAADCSLSIRASYFSGNNASRDGGAVSIVSGSLLSVSHGSRFTGNIAAQSGGAVSCKGCKSIHLREATTFRLNAAQNSGGAVFVQSATSESRSSGSQFLENTAGTMHGSAGEHCGGAIHIIDSAPWSSDSDILKDNTAQHSGGGFAAEGTVVKLNGTTVVTQNTASGAGGGGMYWNSLATDRISTRWKTFAPQISNTVRIEDNRARYGNNTATQPMSLESVFATYAVRSNGKFYTKPRVWAVDYYGQHVQGASLQRWQVEADTHAADGNTLNFGVSGSTQADLSQDLTYFVFDDSFLLVGKRLPDKGPHELRFTGTFLTDSGNRFTTIIPAHRRPQAFIDRCDIGREKRVIGNGVVCASCPDKMTSNGLTCVCDGSASVDGEVGRGYFFNHTKLLTNESDNIPEACSVCPTGADCSHKNHALVHELSAKPGYWRPHADAAVFVDCSRAFSVAQNATLAAVRRCCPLADDLRNNRSESVCSITMRQVLSGNETNKTVESSRQCEPGYGGPMCMACIDASYTMDNQGVCSKCEGGANFGSVCGAMTGVFGALFCVFAFMFLRVDSENMSRKKEKKACCGRKKKAPNMNPSASGKAKENKDDAKGTLEDKLEKKRDKSAVTRFVGDQVMIGRLDGGGSSSSVGGGSQNTSVDTRGDGQIVLDRVKVFYSWLQVLTSVTMVFDVPWPIQFKIMTLRLNFINFDLGGLFSVASCNFALPSITLFKIHMAVPAMLLLTVFLARIPAWFLHKKKGSRLGQQALMMKTIITLVLIIYPGLCVRLFSTLKCVTVPGLSRGTDGQPVEKSVMAVAYDVACENRPLGIAIVASLVWVVGIPLAVFAVLYKNKAHLFDTESDKHGMVVGEYGTLYLQ